MTRIGMAGGCVEETRGLSISAFIVSKNFVPVRRLSPFLLFQMKGLIKRLMRFDWYASIKRC